MLPSAPVQTPGQLATVEVACALEGLAHCMEAASHGGDPEIAQEYAEHCQKAVDFLLSAQVLSSSLASICCCCCC